MGFEVIRGHKKESKGIRDPLQFLGFDCFSCGFNEGFYIQERNAILTDVITILSVSNYISLEFHSISIGTNRTVVRFELISNGI